MHNYFLQLKAKLYKIYCNLFGRVLFRDKFGLKYYLWKDTRLENTIKKDVRTDDEGVILLINLILDKYRTATIANNIGSNDRIIAFDIGAYIGVITLAIAKKLSITDQLFSFEPGEKNFRRLCENSKLNKYENIYPVNCGVSDQESNVNYLRLTKDPGGNYLVNGIDVKNDKEDYNIISTISVSKYCERKGFDKIDILKVDTEGYDLKVLQGAKSLLDKGKIYYIFIECQHPENKIVKEITGMLTKNGYNIFYIVRDSISVVQQLKNYPYKSNKLPLNMLAISPNAPFDKNDFKLLVINQ